MQKLNNKYEKINIKKETKFYPEKSNENIGLQESVKRWAKCWLSNAENHTSNNYLKSHVTILLISSHYNVWHHWQSPI